MSKTLTPNQKRYQDCISLVECKGAWTCDECFGQSIEDIDDCPEGITIEEVQEIDNIKAKITGARAEKADTTQKKPKTVKISDEKMALFDLIWEGLSNYYDNCEIIKQNKLISVTINGKKFKIDLIEERNKK